MLCQAHISCVWLDLSSICKIRCGSKIPKTSYVFAVISGRCYRSSKVWLMLPTGTQAFPYCVPFERVCHVSLSLMWAWHVCGVTPCHESKCWQINWRNTFVRARYKCKLHVSICNPAPVHVCVGMLETCQHFATRLLSLGCYRGYFQWPRWLLWTSGLRYSFTLMLRLIQTPFGSNPFKEVGHALLGVFLLLLWSIAI